MRTDTPLPTGIDELQRISSCMSGAAAPASLAHEAVLSLEMELLRQGLPVGQSLGALPEVQKRLGLGRPASREAVTMLEARGLLDVRPGPGGGLFVAAPALEDVASLLLMHLALTRETYACIEEFRLLVWRMIVQTAIERRVAPLRLDAGSSQGGFAADLAEEAGQTTMGLLARLAEMLTQISQAGTAAPSDCVLEAAIEQRDLAAALERLDELVSSVNHDAPIISLEVAERAFSLAGRKLAIALAARMARELGEGSSTHEAEWETAERLGYSEDVVRRARRILQDFGIIRCRQGRKGAELSSPEVPASVIRLLALCHVASATSALDKLEAISFLVCSAPVLAARHGKADDGPPLTSLLYSSSRDPLESLTLENLLLQLSGNPLLAIAVRSLGVANIFTAGDPLVPPSRGNMIGINRRILQALEAGDVETVYALARKKFELMRQPAERYSDVA